MAEQDISKRIKALIIWSVPTLIIIGIVISSIVWYTMYGEGNITVREAQVASDMVEAKARVTGTIDQILVQDGDVVKAGDVIATVKIDVTEEQLKQLQQTVELSKRNLEQVKKGVTVQTPRMVSQPEPSGVSSAEVEKARSRMERMNQLFEMGAISAVKRDQAVAEYQEAAAAAAASVQNSQPTVTYDTTVQPANPETIKRAELQVKQAQAALDKAKGNAASTEITAPVDGVVHLGDISQGTKIEAGQAVASIGSSDEMWIEAYPTPEQRDAIRLGQAVNYYIDREKYHGLVMDIVELQENDPEDENTEGQQPEQDVHKLVVKISISPENKSAFSVGQPAEVLFLKNG